MNLGKRDIIEFKGTGKGLVLYIHKEANLELIFDLISEKVMSSPKFFIGGILTEIVSNYISPYQKKLIIEYLTENYKMQYLGIDEFHFNELMKRKEYKGATALFKAVRTLYIMDIEEEEEIDYNGTIILMAEVPKSAIIKSSCDIVVLSGTEVESVLIAGGNIIVMGELKGLAYAGAYGNDSACIMARHINSPKIAIFDCVAEGVVSQRMTNMTNPEIAYIDEYKKIVVSQKKEVLMKYSPDSIKDTSYGAFDISEHGVMVEKNEFDETNIRSHKKDANVEEEYWDENNDEYDENYYYENDEKEQYKESKNNNILNKLKGILLEETNNEKNRL